MKMERVKSLRDSVREMLNSGGYSTSIGDTKTYGVEGLTTPEVLGSGAADARNYAMRKCFDAVNEFIDKHQLCKDTVSDKPANEIMRNPVRVNEAGIESIGNEEFISLARSFGIPEERLESAVYALASVVDAHMVSGSSTQSLMTHMFGGPDNDAAKNNMMENTPRGLRVAQRFDPILKPADLMIGVPISGTEAFGVNTDIAQPDMRINLVITGLRFNSGLLDRMAHRRPCTGPTVNYELDTMEIYNLSKAADPDNKVRNRGAHRTNILTLKRDPDKISGTLRKVVALKANDPANLIEDNIFKPGLLYNLIDLSRNPAEPTVAAQDFTDQLEDNARVETVLFEIEVGSNKETFKIAVKSKSSSLFSRYANAEHSAMRLTACSGNIVLMKGIKTSTGTVSTILEALPDGDKLEVYYENNGRLDLRDGYLSNNINLRMAASGASGGEPSTTTANMLVEAAASLKVVGYTVDVYHSEENMRTTDTAGRTITHTQQYQIARGRNFVVDYSIQQKTPTGAMAMMAEIIGIDKDNFALRKAQQMNTDIENRVIQEARTIRSRSEESSLNYQFPSGHRVNPYGRSAVINFNKLGSAPTDPQGVASLRSSDFLSDIVAHTNAQFLQLTADMSMQTLLANELQASNKRPTFAFVTSPVVHAICMSAPHIHNHVKIEKPADTKCDMVRILDNGVELRIITVPWKRMFDRGILLPYLPDMPDSPLNFWHNWDRGSFMSQYNVSMSTEAFQRIFTNVSEDTIITAPISIEVHFTDMVTYFHHLNFDPATREYKNDDASAIIG